MELINPKLRKHKKSIWVIIHVNIDNLYRIDKDLEKFTHKYNLSEGSISAYVPTVRILRKKLKGNLIFETLPLLFTYGFIQIPRKICTPDNLQALKTQVTAIHSYVNDISNGRVAFVTHSEIKTIYENLIDYSVYDKNDLDSLKPGNIVTLRGYPFDEVPARILKVDFETEKVKVEILGDTLIKNSEIDFDNIIFSAYHGVQDETQFKEALFGDMKTKYKTNTTKYE